MYRAGFRTGCLWCCLYPCYPRVECERARDRRDGGGEVRGRDGGHGTGLIRPMCRCLLPPHHGCPCQRKGEERIQDQGWWEAVRVRRRWLFGSVYVYATMAPRDPVGNVPIFGD